MPVGKGSIERAVKAKNASTPKKATASKKTTTSKKSTQVKESVIAATSPDVMEMVTGKRTEKAVRVGDQMPDYLL